MIKIPALSSSGHPHHGRAAQPTEQLPGEHILPIFTMPPLRVFLCFQALAHLQKERLVNDCGHTALDPDPGTDINPGITFIVEHGVKAILSPQAAPPGADSPPIQVVTDFHERNALGHLAEDFFHHHGLGFLDREMPVRPLAVTEGNRAAVHLAFKGIVMHSPFDILGEVSGIILGGAFKHGFQQDTLRPLRYRFFCIDNPDPVPLQPVFVGGAVVPVPGKPVHLPGQDVSPAATGGVFQHFLKLRPFVICPGEVAVGVHFHNPEIYAFGIRHAIGYLLFNRHVPLGVGGITGIYYTGMLRRFRFQIFRFYRHSFTPLYFRPGQLRRGGFYSSR